ncbi:MAG: outer membrane beta-barrel protein, partial [Bryobacteraceae bacterium]
MVSLRAMSVSVCALALAGASIRAWGQAAPAGSDSGQTPAAAPAQTSAPASTAAQTPAPAPAPSPTWSIGPIDFSGLIDGYYSANLNSPSTRTNQLYNFDVQSQQFSLNMAKLSLSHSPDPVGFQVDFGFGKAFTIVHSGESEPQIFQYLEQAYVSFKPPKAKGLEIDFGEFVTTAGAEVIESNANWNYSRSLLFAWAIPYYHFGLRTSFPVGKHFSGGVQVVNGWNNIEDNNSGKTLGFTGTVTYAKWNWANTYYV